MLNSVEFYILYQYIYIYIIFMIQVLFIYFCSVFLDMVVTDLKS